MYIMTINIAKDVPGIKVVSMTKNQTGCLHDYQLTPQDLKTLSTAWIFVVNGHNMESFIDKAVKQYPGIIIIEAGKGIAPITHPVTGETNPHLWVSVTNAMAEVENITRALKLIDPSHASVYQSNSEKYQKKLTLLKQKMHDSLKTLSSRNIITFHEAFPYFAKEFNLTIVSVIEREPGSEPSAGDLAETIGIVKSRHVKALFAEPQYPAKAAQTIARETGIGLYTLDPAVTGPDTPDAYLHIMESNLSILKAALK
jgi:zinc transport system substrate-binding protein